MISSYNCNKTLYGLINFQSTVVLIYQLAFISFIVLKTFGVIERSIKKTMHPSRQFDFFVFFKIQNQNFNPWRKMLLLLQENASLIDDRNEMTKTFHASFVLSLCCIALGISQAMRLARMVDWACKNRLLINQSGIRPRNSHLWVGKRAPSPTLTPCQTLSTPKSISAPFYLAANMCSASYCLNPYPIIIVTHFNQTCYICHRATFRPTFAFFIQLCET